MVGEVVTIAISISLLALCRGLLLVEFDPDDPDDSVDLARVVPTAAALVFVESGGDGSSSDGSSSDGAAGAFIRV